MAPSQTARTKPDFSLESDCPGPVGGIDEAGRAPLAGPVVAAAVILDPDRIPTGVDDSKRLSRAARERLFETIRAEAVAYAVAEASVAEIDEINILQASLLAMRRAVAGLDTAPKTCLVDGNQNPGLDMPTHCIVKGDARSLSIAAAGILAKVSRDRVMADLARAFPDYGWAENAGYSVPAHREALRLVGVTPHHRRSFAPVRETLLQGRLPID